MIRRLALMSLLALVMAPGSASAAGAWHHYRNASMGFSLRYPPGWTLRYVRRQKIVGLSYQKGRQTYSLTVTTLANRAASSIEQTTRSIVAQQRRIGNTVFARIRWTRTALGGKRAMVGVSNPPKVPGGVTISSGIYLAQWRARVYQVVILAYGKRPLSRISQFPSTYGWILSTWRFI